MVKSSPWGGGSSSESDLGGLTSVLRGAHLCPVFGGVAKKVRKLGSQQFILASRQGVRRGREDPQAPSPGAPLVNIYSLSFLGLETKGEVKQQLVRQDPSDSEKCVPVRGDSSYASEPQGVSPAWILLDPHHLVGHCGCYCSSAQGSLRISWQPPANECGVVSGPLCPNNALFPQRDPSRLAWM